MDKSVADLIVRSSADNSVDTEKTGKVYKLDNRANMYKPVSRFRDVSIVGHFLHYWALSGTIGYYQALLDTILYYWAPIGTIGHN